MGGGIARDIIDGFLKWLLADGEGVNVRYNQYSDSSDHPLLENTSRILPAFTVLNNGSNTVYLGWGSTGGTNSGFPLSSGSSYTFRWKNPRSRGGLVYNPNGNAIDLRVIS